MNKITRYIRTSTRLQALVLFSLFPSLVFLPSNMQANPSGGVVMGGAAEIGEGLNGHLQIMQHSNRAVIDWAQFSIAAGELTQFIQPGADAAVLNRVTSGSPSAIMGALQANGNVAVINTAGILVGPTGTIDVNGLMLSTLDVSNADFMGGGDMIFRGATAAGVTNMGRINAVGGDVFLLGKTVVNTGAISAANGTVGLAAGEEVLITAVANPAGERVFVRPTAGVKSGTGVDNSGTIEGAMVELKAHGNMYALAINNSGSIRATGATTNGGKVTLRAIGGTITNTGSIAATLPSGTGGRIIIDAGVGGTVNAGGKIDASAKGKGQIGGVVMISGESVTVPGGADISANGDGGGGFIQIGSGDGVDAMNVAVEAGSKISANGVSGPGGMVVIQGGADSNVMVAGSVSANSESGAGGIIIVEGGDVAVTQTSTLEANGATGGLITVTGENSAVVNGTLNAVGSAGDGGMINISGGNSTLVGSTANINAGGSVNGGWVKITSGGETTMGGTVNSVGGSGIGGKVDTVGAAVELAASARIDASGLAGGGRVRIGGSLQGRHPTLMNATTTTVQSGARIVADATGNGDGGTVIVWADEDTIYRGDISARGAGVGRGGFVEVSGKESLFFDGEVDTLAADGSAGILLLDPRNMTISGAANSANNINDGTLEGLVVANNVVVSTFSGDAEAGNITVTGQVRYNSGNSLTLLAEHDIYVANDIINQGAGNVNLVAGWDSGNLSLATLLGGAPTSPGSTFGDVNMDASFFDTAFYGVDNGFGNGSVYIGTSDAGITGANTNVVVGSRTGQTNVAGYDVNVWGGVTTTGENRYSQIGYDREEAGTANALAPSGRIRVQSVNDVSIIGGYSNQGGPGDVGGVGRYSYGHIGHGGDWGSARQAMSGDIIVEAGRDVTGQAGQNRQNFVMIGHGGVYGDDVNNTGVIGGNITVTAGRNVDF